MAGEQFSLCWDNFHSNMSTGLSSLLKTEDLVDVTLAAEGRYLKAHKMVLSVCSPYFRELFQVNPCQHPIVFLKDVSFTALNNLLEFMYQGEVKVSQDELGTFIKTAEALKIKGLTGDVPSHPYEAESESAGAQNNSTATPPLPSLSRKIAREKSPPPRKKMLGPASKRFKTDAEVQFHQQSHHHQSHHQQSQHHQQQQQEQSANQNLTEQSGMKHHQVDQQIVHFKMEPEETAVSLSNEDDGHYDDSAIDEMGMDNSADYMLETTAQIDMKNMSAGTSAAADNAEAVGENQDEELEKLLDISDKDSDLNIGELMYMVNRRGQMALIFEDNIFHVNRRYEGTTFWKCMEYKKLQCRCRCTTVNGTIKRSKTEHNHPPNIQKIQKKFLQMKCLATSENRPFIY